MLAFVVHAAGLTEALSLAPPDLHRALAASWQRIDCILYELVLHAEENHALHFVELLGHITGPLAG